MATAIQSTKLDFENIKISLRKYLAAKDEYKDFNFEAAGINNILDVLAYNTHFNALTANFALNEAFLNTAQLRSSVIAHATTLGYETRSRTAAEANITMSLNLNGVAGRPNVISIPAGFSFTSKVGEQTFTFLTTELHSATDDGLGVYNFLNSEGTTSIKIKEGTKFTKTFFVGEAGERVLYVIPDNTMDTATASVKVYADPASTNFVSYSRLSEAVSVTSTSRYFQITEAPNGFYELNFGDGISFGKSPEPGNKIEVEYLSVQGADANGASTFKPSDEILVNGVNYPLLINTVANSLNGSDVQSIESIRQNAPIAYAAQQRLVTAEDYKAVILKNYTSVLDATAWGGEDNAIPDYGKVYVSLVFQEGTLDSAKQVIKDSIVTNVTNNLSIISIDTKFADPVTTFLELGATFNFDPSLSGVTEQTAASNVMSLITQFFTDNLNKFGGVFRRSNLLSEIDNLSPAILNSRVEVKMQQRFEPTLNVPTSYDITFPTRLAAPSSTVPMVTTDTFIFNNRICQIKNRLNSNVLQIINSSAAVEVDNIGSWDETTGVVSLVGFTPTGITSGQSFLKLTVTPSNQATIKPLRNYILSLDTDPSFAAANIDRQLLSSSLGVGVSSQVTSSSSSGSSSSSSSSSGSSSGY